MQTKNCRILEEDLNRINELSQAQGRTQWEIINELLNNTHESNQAQGKVTNDKVPIITKCLWDFYYWKAKNKDRETGQVLQWDKVDECPIFSIFPDILDLPANQRIGTLMKACNTCLLKEKALKQAQKREERQRSGYHKKQHEDFGEISQEPTWRNNPTSGDWQYGHPW